MGQAFHQVISSRTVSRRLIKLDGAVLQRDEEQLSYTLDSDVRIVEVNARGQIIRSELVVARCLIDDGSQERSLLPAGSVIRVTQAHESEGEGTIELVGGSLGELEEAVLRELVPTTYGDDGDDSFFGTDEPQRIGSTWNVDTDTLWAELGDIPELDTAQSQIAGRSTLEALEAVGGMDCLRIRSSIEADGFTMRGLPAGAVTEHAALSATHTGWFPTDPSVRRLREEEVMEMGVRMRLEVGDMPAGAILEVTEQTTRTAVYQR